MAPDESAWIPMQLRKGLARIEDYFRNLPQVRDRVYGQPLLDEEGNVHLSKEVLCWEDLVMRSPEQRA